MTDTGWTFQGYRVLESENVPTPVGIRYTDSHQERTMTVNHIDQLAQWYADAEQVTKTNLPRKGDTLIYPRRTSGYIIESDGGGWTPGLVHSTGEPARILSRAPKPRYPFPAILATYRDENGMVSGVWRPEGKPGYWEGPEGDVVHEDSLEAVTPLIEAKVTDEMIDRILDVIDARFDNYPAGIGEELAVAALGIEAE